MSSKSCNKYQKFMSNAYRLTDDEAERKHAIIKFVARRSFPSGQRNRNSECSIDLLKIGFFILIFSEIAGGERRKECPESCQTIKATLFCPDNEYDWNIAAKKMGCANLVQDCTKKDNFLYHCLPYADLDSIHVELCAPKTNIIGGYCPKFDPVGKMVVENYKSDCKNHSIPCPDVFESSIAYKHQGCFQKKAEKYVNTEFKKDCSQTVQRGSTPSDENQIFDSFFRFLVEKIPPIFTGILLPVVVVPFLICCFWVKELKMSTRRKLHASDYDSCSMKMV